MLGEKLIETPLQVLFCVSYLCHICVIPIKIQAVFSSLTKGKTPINTGFVEVLKIELIISLRTEAHGGQL